MKKALVGIVMILVLIGLNVYAADGDLIVNGTVQASNLQIGPAGARQYWKLIENTSERLDYIAYNAQGQATAIPLIFQGTDPNSQLVATVGVDWATPHTYKFTVNGWGAATLGWATISDLRIKKNVTTAGPMLNSVLQLRPVWYQVDNSFESRLKLGTNPNQYYLGLVAQEVEKVLPDLVTSPSNPADIKGIDYGRLTVVLIGAIQELQKEIDALKAGK